MYVKYFGRKTKNSFGEKLARELPPVAEVGYSEKEEAFALSCIEYTGYQFDSFNDGGCCSSDVYVEDRNDFEDFYEMFKEAKKVLKKG